MEGYSTFMSKIMIKVPAAGESVQEAMIAAWLKEDGDYVEQDEPVVELETDKASMEVVAERAGVLSTLVAAGEIVKVGQEIARLDVTKVPVSEAVVQKVDLVQEDDAHEPKDVDSSASVEKSSEKQKKQAVAAHLYPGPAVARLAQDSNVSVADLQQKIGKGSGHKGRLTKGDVLKYQQTQSLSVEENKTSLSKDLERAVLSSRTYKRESMTMIRRRIAQRLLSATQETAMLTTFNEVDMSAIFRVRQMHRDAFFERHQVKLGFMGFFMKASVAALQRYPQVNSQIQDDSILQFSYCDVGVAVSTPKGLVVPVVRDAQDLSLAEIEYQVADYAKRAREKKITLEDMQGGTFTITNGGVFGSLLSTPILNPPQSAILGMHKIQQRPVVQEDGSIVAKPMMYLALSYDHRIVDGREAVQFLVAIKDSIEDPHRMLLDL